VAVAVAVGGCGGGGGNRSSGGDPKAAVEGFAKAFGAGDGTRACDLLTTAARGAFLKRVHTLAGTNSCPTAIKRVHDAAGSQVTSAFAAAKVTGVKLHGSTGTATLTASGHSTSVGLAKEGGSWRLTGVPGI
jgi:hypothetical protein